MNHLLRLLALFVLLASVSACDSGTASDVNGPFTITSWLDSNEGWSFEDQQLVQDESEESGLADFHVDENLIHAWATGAMLLTETTLDDSPVPGGTYRRDVFSVELGDIVAVQTRDGRYAKIAVTEVLPGGLAFNQVFPVTRVGGSPSVAPRPPTSASAADHASR